MCLWSHIVVTMVAGIVDDSSRKYIPKAKRFILQNTKELIDLENKRIKRHVPSFPVK